MNDAPPSYLDHASGEPLHPAAREALERALPHGHADPRALHLPGRRARMLLDNARAVVAECLEVTPEEVTFAPSGTHAVHLGLLGLHRGRARHGRTLVHTAVEHSAVLQAARWTGDPVVAVGVDATGRAPLEGLLEAVTTASSGDDGVSVVAVQSANHEVGTLQPVTEVADLVGNVPVFTDACSSMGRLPLPRGWSAAAGSAHKWGGPAGVGVLLVRRGARWRPPFPVDERLDPRSTGFENVPGALAAAAALQAVVADREATASRQHALVDRIRRSVSAIPDTEVVGDPDRRLPHVVTFSFLYLAGEAVVTELDRRGVAVASGSACTASTLEPSHVLAAMGALTHGNVRLSVGPATTDAEVHRLLGELPGLVQRLRDDSGVPR